MIYHNICSRRRNQMHVSQSTYNITKNRSITSNTQSVNSVFLNVKSICFAVEILHAMSLQRQNVKKPTDIAVPMSPLQRGLPRQRYCIVCFQGDCANDSLATPPKLLSIGELHTIAQSASKPGLQGRPPHKCWSPFPCHKHQFPPRSDGSLHICFSSRL